MKIAIHERAGSFSDRWLEYCRSKGINPKRVNCYDSNIVDQVRGCDGLLWHWAHWDCRAAQFARQLTHSLERMGVRVFPDSLTCWHYDDKVGQKYLLEAIDAPLVPSYVFYDKDVALEWLDHVEFPKVFKLRRGAGSANVLLVRSRPHASRLIHRAFGPGFSAVNRRSLLKERIWHWNRDRNLRAFLGLGKGLARLVVPTTLEKAMVREKGYVYFQDFIPGNVFDIRIIVVGKRAFGIKRMVRANDFRASGSGSIIYDKNQIGQPCVELSFELARRLGTQCLAFDYVLDGKRPLLTEISYAFIQEGYRDCPGYWDVALGWHEGSFIAEHFLIEDFITSIELNS